MASVWESCQGMGQKAKRSTINHVNRKMVFISQTHSVKLFNMNKTYQWKYNIHIVNINDNQSTSTSSLCCHMQS